MKSIYSVLVAASLITPASAGKLGSALRAFDKEYQGQIAQGSRPILREYQDWESFDKLRKAMRVRQARYAAYKLQMSSLITTYLMRCPPNQNDVTLANFLDLQKRITVKHSRIQQMNELIVSSYVQNKSGLEAYGQMKNNRRQLPPTREKAQQQEDMWKTFLASLQQNPAITETLKHSLGKDFEDLLNACSLYPNEKCEQQAQPDKSNQSNDSEDDDNDDDEEFSFKEAKHNLEVDTASLKRSLSLLDYVKARVQHFAVVWYSPDVNPLPAPAVPSQPLPIAQHSLHPSDDDDGVHSPIQQQQELQVMPPVSSPGQVAVVHQLQQQVSADDDDGVVPPPPLRSDDAHHEASVASSSGIQSQASSPRGVIPTSSAPASPHDSPPLQRRTSTVAVSSGQPTQAAEDPLRAASSSSSSSSTVAAVAEAPPVTTGGRGGKSGRGKRGR